MAEFKLIETGIADLLIIEPQVFGDSRGYFQETYNEESFRALGLNYQFVQDNESKSSKGVLRGLHFQTQNPQGKLVRVVTGEVYDVAVDLRKSSKTFGKWFGVHLSEENKRMFFVPEGFAHGFLVLSDNAVFSYKCTNFYAPQYDAGIVWNDPEIGIEWPLEDIVPLLSDKDRGLPLLKDITVPFE